jgi:replicative superfamily II helicase
MHFHGLFIGIDRYASEEIAELTCARRDAVALEALFADTLSGSGKTSLLTDADATRGRIESEFQQLTNCSPGDTVIISFSGHGAPHHGLVMHDTDLKNLDATTIPLNLLSLWFSRIPAKRLILLLDCCFSGGMGAKVLQIDEVARDLIRSAASRLEELAGEGRLILTASKANEPAYESTNLGHGFFTYHLLEALQGPEEVVDSGKLPVYRLLEYVTRRVIDETRLKGKPQHPTLRGQIDGEVAWPVFVPGDRYRSAFPERPSTLATADLTSLCSFGFPPELVAAWAGAIPSLNTLQISAINEYGILEGKHLVVSAPTSSGKTMIGELAALKNALARRRALFLLPLKALVADKKRHFDHVYGALGFRTIVATGETDDISPLLRGHYDIALLTYEKFASIALTHSYVLEQAGTIVIDEAQMIADRGRGANLEFILTLVATRRTQGIEPQTIALSAVIGDTNGFERWLGARLLRTFVRPVVLDEGVLLVNGVFRFIDGESAEERRIGPMIQPFYRKGSSQDLIIPLVDKLVNQGEQVIVFRETKGDTRGCARYLAASLGLPPAKEALALLPNGDPSLASQDLRQTLEGGVAFHNADLDPEERRIIEEQFRAQNTTLRVIVATTTLAMGINTPASSVVIAGLDHPGAQRATPYSVAEYKNLAGRAGRLGLAERGTSYLIAMNNEQYYWSKYVTGSLEDLVSRFLDARTDPRTLILRVMVAGRHMAVARMPADEIILFLEGSFGAFQARQQSEHWQWNRSQIENAFTDLERHDLIERAQDDAFGLTPLGRLAGESTIEVESIVRLVDALRPLTSDQITDPALISAAQLTVELDDVLFPLNKASTRKEPGHWPRELRRQAVPAHIIGSMSRSVTAEHQPTIRSKKAIACLLYVSSLTMNQIEANLTQFGGRLDGAAGPIRAVASRTADLLPATARVAELLHPDLDLSNRLLRLLTRLTYGVPAAAADLASYAGGALLRGDYLRLAAAGLCEPERIEAADEAALLSCVDGDPSRLRLIHEASASLRRERERLAQVTSNLPEYEP